MIKKRTFCYVFIFCFLLLDLISSAQIKLKIINYPRFADLSSDSIIKVTVRFTNQTNKDFIFFYTKVPLVYEDPSEFYIDSLIPPTAISIFTDSHGQLVKPKIQFKYFQIEFIDFEAQKKFNETQSKLMSLQDSLKKMQIKETGRNPFLLPSGDFKDIEYSINIKDFLIHSGFFDLQITYECGSVLWFEKLISDNIKSQYKDSEIFFGKIQTNLVRIKIND